MKKATGDLQHALGQLKISSFPRRKINKAKGSGYYLYLYIDTHTITFLIRKITIVMDSS